ncbi:MAG: glycosyltransferase [Chthoniobacterales bacterium]
MMEMETYQHVRYEWKPYADSGPMATTRNSTNLSVIVPLFPRHAGLRHALTTLRAQTLRPDLVVFLDDGQASSSVIPEDELPGIPVQVAQADTKDVAHAINQAVDYLDHSKYIAILGAGGAYAPRRLEECLKAIEDPSRFRQPGLVVTGANLVDGRGVPLAPDDKRRAQLARLWAPGQQGVGLPEWLGTCDFVLSAANIFARRSYLLENHLLTGVSSFAYHAAIQAGVQGYLRVVDEPLLELNWSAPDSIPSGPAAAALLRAQVQLLAALREKLATSPDTRRNFAAFHRAAWNNISGLREDLFAQAAFQLASLAPQEDTVKVADRFTTAPDLLTPPPHWQLLHADSHAAPDPAAYAAALAKTRAELEQLKEENQRLGRVADAAQNSGWVRFGAWVGDHGARRIMEMDEDVSVQPPNGEVQSGGEHHPNEVGNKQP